MKSDKTVIIIGILVCIASLFASSSQFVNVGVTPKWLGMMICVGIAGMVFRKMAHPLLVIIAVCFLLIFTRNLITHRFCPSLLMYLCGLLLLLHLALQIYSVSSTRYLFGAIIVFALALSIYGILQYVGIMTSDNSNFAVKGNFDNPAGFASALACILPLCLFFLNEKTKYVKYTAIVSGILIAIAIVLSGSRTGILAVVTAILVWSLFQYKMTTRRFLSGIILATFGVALLISLYFLKKESADGRLLIWQNTWDMVAEKPVFGHGVGAFQEKYMLYQAAYFDTNADSRFAQLADNTLYPFNEYLFVLVEYGFVGLGIVTLLFLGLMFSYRRNPCEKKLTALMSLLALAVFSFFSYPFRYPFSWVMLFLNVSILAPVPNHRWKVLRFKHLKHTDLFYKSGMLLLSTGVLALSIGMIRAEITWYRIARQAIAGKMSEVSPEYERLYSWLGSNGFFLYNHAVELNITREFERSIVVFERCMRHNNDLDIQMFQAENFKELGKYAEAELLLKTAANMCPARFMPLYKLVKLYVETDRKDEALLLANKIMNKDVKIPSTTVDTIKNEMRQMLEAQ